MLSYATSFKTRRVMGHYSSGRIRVKQDKLGERADTNYLGSTDLLLLAYVGPSKYEEGTDAC